MARIEINTPDNLIPDQRLSADADPGNNPHNSEGDINPDHLLNAGQLIQQGYDPAYAEVHPANKHRASNFERRRHREALRDAALLAATAIGKDVIVDAKTGLVLTPDEQEDIATRRHDGVHV